MAFTAGSMEAFLETVLSPQPPPVPVQDDLNQEFLNLVEQLKSLFETAKPSAAASTPPPAPVPTVAHVTGHPRTFIISMDSEEGNKRKAMRGPLKDYESYVKGYSYEEVPQNFIDAFQGRHRGDCRKNSIACLFSHAMCWTTIEKDGIPTIIMEDDSVMCRTLDHQLLDGNSLCLLGGVLRTPHAWNREKQEWIDSGKFVSLVSSFQAGVNPLTPPQGEISVVIVIITVIIIVIVIVIIIAIIIIIIVVIIIVKVGRCHAASQTASPTTCLMLMRVL
jgi:hypothetical protein